LATQYLKVTGKIEWAHKLFIPDEYNGAKRYICSFFPDKESKQKIKDSGLKLVYKSNSKNFPGEEYVSPRRDLQKLIKGEIVEFGRPRIVNKDYSDIDPNVRIGAGTQVEMTIAVYDAGRYKGHRLETVRILDLVTYEKEQTEGQKEAAKSEPTTKVIKPKLPF